PGAGPRRYALENIAAAPAGITAGAAGGQATAVGTRFPIPLAVTVTDKSGNPVADAVVIFTAPARGASGAVAVRRHVPTTPRRVRPTRKGTPAPPRCIANAKAGGCAVTVSVKGTSVRTAFSLLNLPRG